MCTVVTSTQTEKTCLGMGALNAQPNRRANLANDADALQAISRDQCSDCGSSHSILVLKGKTKKKAPM